MDRVFSLESLLFTSFSVGVACVRSACTAHAGIRSRTRLLGKGKQGWLRGCRVCLCVCGNNGARVAVVGGGGVQTVILLADILRLSPKGGSGGGRTTAQEMCQLYGSLGRVSQSVSQSAARESGGDIREGRGLRRDERYFGGISKRQGRLETWSQRASG